MRFYLFLFLSFFSFSKGYCASAVEDVLPAEGADDTLRAFIRSLPDSATAGEQPPLSMEKAVKHGLARVTGDANSYRKGSVGCVVCEHESGRTLVVGLQYIPVPYGVTNPSVIASTKALWSDWVDGEAELRRFLSLGLPAMLALNGREAVPIAEVGGDRFLTLLALSVYLPEGAVPEPVRENFPLFLRHLEDGVTAAPESWFAGSDWDGNLTSVGRYRFDLKDGVVVIGLVSRRSSAHRAAPLPIASPSELSAALATSAAAEAADDDGAVTDLKAFTGGRVGGEGGGDASVSVTASTAGATSSRHTLAAAADEEGDHEVAAATAAALQEANRRRREAESMMAAPATRVGPAGALRAGKPRALGIVENAARLLRRAGGGGRGTSAVD